MSDRTDWTDFSTEMMREVHRLAGGVYLEDAFFDYFKDHLVETGEVETAERMSFRQTHGGLRVDGYGGNPADADGVLTLFILDFEPYREGETPKAITKTDLNEIFPRLTRFLSKAHDAKFRASIEESDEGWQLADLVHSSWPDVTKVRLFLLSNRVISARVDGQIAATDFHGKEVTYNLWDLSRLGKYVRSGKATEDTYIDLVREYGRGIETLPAHITEVGYRAYLSVLPADMLAKIYDKWGSRLLESNVRVFLSARGRTNQGIRDTLKDDPGMFFAYNNGLSATATDVETEVRNGVTWITTFRNLQIVNGGQTTASIHRAWMAKGRDRVDLSSVFVQMKLSILPEDRYEEATQNISKYANKQNAVSDSDLESNKPYHQKMQEFSRRIYIPSPEGTFRLSKWYYERTRGQYENEKNRPTARGFTVEYPVTQKFSKTDLAKYLGPWEGIPHTVSAGAQKNFTAFTKVITGRWKANPEQFDEAYYREMIAKAIIWKATEKLVTEQKAWYHGGGLRSRIVPYAIAKVAHDAGQRGVQVDFERIWREQAISPELGATLVAAARVANGVIADPPRGNPLEWGKAEGCWVRVRGETVAYPPRWLDDMVVRRLVRSPGRTGRTP